MSYDKSICKLCGTDLKVGAPASSESKGPVLEHGPLKVGKAGREVEAWYCARCNRIQGG